MALTVGKLCNDENKKFQLKLIAGAKGRFNIVNWVHIVEDIQVANFLLGHELVFTTGIGNIRDTKNMMLYINTLIEKEVSGLVINVGPYIETIAPEIVDYCNQKDFPVYTCPWEVRLVEVTKYYCQRLFNSEATDRTMASNLKDYIFYPEQRDKIQFVLERQGMQWSMNYCVVTFGFNGNARKDPNADNARLEFFARKELERLGMGAYALFWYERKLSIILAGMETDTIRDFVRAIDARSTESFTIYIGVSAVSENMGKLDINFNRSRDVQNMCIKKQERILFYDDMGMYKIIFSVEDKAILAEFANQAVGKIKEYDLGNETDYFEFIKTFIQNDGSIQKTADSLFVHRNTINYKLAKIKKITGMDMTSLNDLLLLKLSLEIDSIS